MITINGRKLRWPFFVTGRMPGNEYEYRSQQYCEVRIDNRKLKRELGFRDLTLFYVVSGLSLRWIATAAATGPSALGVWLLAWCGFFLPLAGCVLELSSRYPRKADFTYGRGRHMEASPHSWPPGPTG